MVPGDAARDSNPRATDPRSSLRSATVPKVASPNIETPLNISLAKI